MDTVVVICTYNEAENIRELLDEILKKDPGIQVLVVDDNSPDGTGRIVREIGRSTGRVELMHREGKRGRGLAGIAGFRRALEEKADCIIEMDADFSHNPDYLPLFLEKIHSCDVVVGSRFVAGGGEKGRSLLRKVISKLANLFIRLALGLKVKDCSSGFRCFRREVLTLLPWEKINAVGPSLVEEILYHCCRRGFRIEEIPIVFEERKKGESKLSLLKLMETFWQVLKIRWLK